MDDQEPSYPVIATLSPKNGVFLVCEPKGSTSEVACRRDELEKKLSSFILQTLLNNESSQEDVETFNQGQQVAVSTSHIKYWQRGVVIKKYGDSYDILLVDWGIMAENVMKKDIQPLHSQFKALPHFSREAVLEGIKPMTQILDYTGPSGPILKESVVADFDVAALQFIEDTLYGSSETRMNVKGEDGRYLYIRLFLKPQGATSSCCLNDELCKKGYAKQVIGNGTLISTDVTSKPKLIEPQVDDEYEKVLRCYSVTFSDYADSYEKIKAEQKVKEQQSAAKASKSEVLTPSSAGTQRGPSPNDASYIPKKPLGRGKLLTLPDDADSATTRTVTDTSFNERSNSSQYLSTTQSTNESFSFDEKPSSQHSNSVKEANLHHVLSSRNLQQQRSVLNTSSDSFSSGGSRRADFSMGRGRKLLEACAQLGELRSQDRNSSFCSTTTKKKDLNQIENQPTDQQAKTAINQLYNSCRSQVRNDEQINVNSKPPSPQVETPSSKLKLFPAGMPINPLPQSQSNYKAPQPRAPPQQITRPVFPRAPRQALAPTQRVAEPMFLKPEPVIRPFNENLDLLSALQLATAKNRSMGTTSPKAAGVSRPLNSRAETLKVALMGPAQQTSPMKQVSPVTLGLPVRQASPVTELQKESLSKFPVVAEREEPAAPPSSLFDDEEVRNTMELLELVSGKPYVASEKKTLPQLQLPKSVELLKEGRVLVRCPWEVEPVCNLNEIPFEDAIHEALGRLGIRHPKPIQSYVWETLLRLTNVAFVSGSKRGKTLGYLVPILSSLLDDSAYIDVPKGCSPRAIVICPSWASTEAVYHYSSQLTTRVAEKLRVGYLADRSPESIKTIIPFLINGVSLLAITAPALQKLLEESQDVINFDRCCHLVFEDAEVLLKNHYSAICEIIRRYQLSVQRTKSNPNHVHMPRQVVACASQWNAKLKALTTLVLEDHVLFISSCSEAAVYGQMKLHLYRGTNEDMKAALVRTVQEKKEKSQRIVVFCRNAEEIHEVDSLLKTINVCPLTAHGQAVISDLDHITSRWKYASPGNAILLCTDDVFTRLDIKNAEVLIHYYIPTQSKYDFNYRFSFAMDNFLPEIEDHPRPESFVLVTDEFKNSLLGIVLLMERLGYTISEELKTEAIMLYCDKQVDKKDFRLCDQIKILGECPNVFLCKKRHLIRRDWDQPVLPFKNGMVRIRITAVHSATQYYARILKYCGEDRKLIDTTTPGLALEADIRRYFSKEGSYQDPVQPLSVEVGQVLARKSMEGLYERVRIEEIGEKNFTGLPSEVVVFFLDRGEKTTCRMNELFNLADHLKIVPPQAVEIILVGLRPLDKDPVWPRQSVDFARERILHRELDGRIVLALSSTLWLSPLHERRKVDGGMVVVTDIHKDLLDTHRAEKNEEHLQKLYDLCKIGQVSLLDYSVGIAVKKVDEPDVRYAFLPLLKETIVQVSCFLNPEQFYVTMVDYQKLLRELESDISKEVSKCNPLEPEEAKPGKFCLAPFSRDNQEVWCRCCIKHQEDNRLEVFYVDYGLVKPVQLEHLKALPRKFAERLPFQAISCSLDGLKPLNETWTKDIADIVNSHMHPSKESQVIVSVEALEKSQEVDPVTKSTGYSIKLTIREDKAAISQDLAKLLIEANLAVPTIKNTTGSVLHDISEPTNEVSTQKPKTEQHKEEPDEEETVDDPMDVSPGWIEGLLPALERQGFVIHNERIGTSEEVNSAKDDRIEKRGESESVQAPRPLLTSTIEKHIIEDNQSENCENLVSTEKTMHMKMNNIELDDEKSATLSTPFQKPLDVFHTESDVSGDIREYAAKVSTLIDHTAPLKSADSSFPTTKWYQNKEQVTVTFEIGEVTTYEVDVSPNSLSFMAIVKQQKYELKTNTYGVINTMRSSHKKTSAGVVLKLQKQHLGQEWIRLIQSPKRPDWLRRDFTHISEFFSDSEESPESPTIDPKYAFEYDQDSTDASSDYELPDEKDFDDDYS